MIILPLVFLNQGYHALRLSYFATIENHDHLVIPFFSWSSTFFIAEKKSCFYMFEKLNVQNFYCDVLEYAKYHQVSLSNKKFFVSFRLIYMDVWGPTKSS